jgi:hypothetical protein
VKTIRKRTRNFSIKNKSENVGKEQNFCGFLALSSLNFQRVNNFMEKDENVSAFNVPVHILHKTYYNIFLYITERFTISCKR